jgi:cytoskeleton protein RodZ
MTTVGSRLRIEREARAMTIEQVAEATGVAVVYLEAMETGSFDALPGRAFGKLYIRAYAEVLDFDARPLIEEYDRERQLTRGEAAEPSRPAPAGSRPVAEAIARWKATKTTIPEAPEVEPPAPEPLAAAPEEPEALVDSVEPATPGPQAPAAKSNRGLAVLVAVAVVVIAAGIYFAVRETTPREPADAIPVEPTPVVQPPAAPVPTPPAIAKPRTAPPPSAPGALSVAESGLGRRIVSSRLEGDGSRFAPGEVAWFQTRVLGGRAGETVRHVWIYDGRAQQSITLRLGGGDWRTHSSKTIYRAGPWTVEARDKDGRVLASASFTCAPRGDPGP